MSRKLALQFPGSLDAQQPVDWANPINTNRAVWWLVSPFGHPSYRGGNLLRELVGRNGGPYNGTLTNGALWNGANGRRGGTGSIFFDGVNDWVTVGGSTFWATNSTDFSVAAWFNTTTPSTYQAIIGKDVSGARDWVFGLSPTVSSVVQFFSQVSAAAAVTGSTTIVANTWYRALVSRIGNSWTLYLNGKSDGTGTDSSNFQFSNAVRIGAREFSGFEQPFSGLLDDICIWFRGLSSTDAQQDYEDSLSGHTKSLRWCSSIVYSFKVPPVSYTRTTTDAPTTSESIARTFVGSRSLSDAPQTVESLSRLFQGFRANSDNPQTAESISRLFSGSRSNSDNVQSLESLSRVFSGNRSITDSPQTSESLSRLFQGFRINTDSPTLSDSSNAIANMPRSSTDSISTLDDLSRLFQGVRTTIDSLTTIESISAIALLPRLSNDSITVSESLERAFQGFRVTTDSVQTLESLSQSLIGSRITVDSISIIESITRLFQGFRSTVDSPNILESPDRQLQSFRVTTDSLSTADNVSQTITTNRVTTDALLLSESVTRLFSGTRNLTNTIFSSESVNRLFIGFRSVVDTGLLSDIATRGISRNRVVVDVLSTSETVSTSRVLYRTITDHITISEVVVQFVRLQFPVIVYGSYDPYLYVQGDYTFSYGVLGTDLPTTITVLGTDTPTSLTVQGLLQNSVTVYGSSMMGILTDISWRRGDKKTFIVQVTGTDSMVDWTATLEWSIPVSGQVVLSKTGVVDHTARTISFDIESADTASIYSNTLEWNVWRTDAGALDSDLGYGTVSLSGNPLTITP